MIVIVKIIISQSQEYIEEDTTAMEIINLMISEVDTREAEMIFVRLVDSTIRFFH